MWKEGEYLINVYRLQGSDRIFIKIKKLEGTR